MFQRTHMHVTKIFFACLLALCLSSIFSACDSQSNAGTSGLAAAKLMASGPTNLFADLGLSQTEIDTRVNNVFNQLFDGDDNQRLYYTSGSDMAYIKAIDSDDVRSEGMSYGMMICVQMDKQTEFNKLWNWAHTYMQHDSGNLQYYFAWQCSSDGSQMDSGPAPDGEMYFVTALLFASQKWGNGSGIYNYREEAQKIMDAMRTKNDMINLSEMQITFSPLATSFTDPSYHLPAFYECWARLDTENSDFWYEMADSSRVLLAKATNDSTGLAPDYSTFDGEPYSGYGSDHQYFRYDAWRVAMNIAVDWAWWGKESWEQTHADTIQSFFYDKGVDTYTDLWTVDGQQLDNGYHSEGLISMNACASLAATNSTVKNAFVQEFWDTAAPEGTYRYYNGMLYMMAMLHCSGKFQPYLTSIGDDDDDDGDDDDGDDDDGDDDDDDDNSGDYLEITTPFVYDGAGNYAWMVSSVPNYINSWNLDSLTINGVDYTNTWVSTQNLPESHNGNYFIDYQASFPWSHMEIK